MAMLTPVKTNGEPLVMPVNTLGRLRREMDRAFDRFFDPDWSLEPLLGRRDMLWAPPVDILDGEKDVIVRLEIPGIDPKLIDISLAGSQLTISGEKKDEFENKGYDFYQLERRYGSFKRLINLPETVDPDKINAEYLNGMLMIKIPKIPAAKPKHVEIKPVAKF